MKFLRTASTRRLLAAIAGVVAVAAAGTAIAVAASGGGPVPKPEPLAEAIHGALAAPKLTGISARIKFTNHLIDSSELQGSDPLLSGASGRLWLSDRGQLRLELQSDNGDAQVIVSGGHFWISDPKRNTVYEGDLPKDTPTAHAHADTVPPLRRIESELNKLTHHLNFFGAASGQIPGARPGDVAGRPTYSVRVSPQHDGGLFGSVSLAWDALKGVPLDFAVYASGDNSPVLELRATDISFGSISNGVFGIKPPKGDKVVRVSTPTSGGPAAHDARHRHRESGVRGLAAVAARLPFTLHAPASVDGLPRRSVSLLDWGGKPGALIFYGQNLGGIVVIERPAGSQPTKLNGGRGLNLPTVSINGTTAQELATALGTMLRFDRDGVSYTLLGSVPPTAAELAAKGL
jgi:outer membrane lipoprotein-sorting protein